ncbi:MAG: FliH/SctL family protein [Planctomycetota bacterium]
MLERGRAEGEAQAIEGAAGILQEAADRLDAAREQALDQLAGTAVELAVEIARQLLQVELQAGNYDLERIVRSSLSHSGLGRGNAVVHVSPEDMDRLAHVTFRKGTEIEADAKLSMGDVHVQSPRGLLVREVDACLETIREQLLEDMA